MTDDQDDKTLAYLWDPAAPEEPGVKAIEQHLLPLRFDAAARPFKTDGGRDFRPAESPGLNVWWKLLAAAAVIVIVTGVGFSQWRFAWPSGRAWIITSASASAPSRLEVGATLSVPVSEEAIVNVARIGTMRIGGGSQVTLRSTQGSRHRLRMDTGDVNVRVWAPPGSVAIQTPTGEVIDLGCEFDLHVEADVSRVQVRSGWVQIDNGVGESLIPAGASGEMRRDRVPGVPIFTSASSVFRTAVRQIERSSDEASLRTILEQARVEDVLTLLMLVEQVVGGVDRRNAGADQLAVRAAELWPPPADVTVGQVIRGDRDALWQWRDTLPLPPPKGWLRNWQDALPRWLFRDPR